MLQTNYRHKYNPIEIDKKTFLMKSEINNSYFYSFCCFHYYHSASNHLPKSLFFSLTCLNALTKNCIPYFSS